MSDSSDIVTNTTRYIHQMRKMMDMLVAVSLDSENLKLDQYVNRYTYFLQQYVIVNSMSIGKDLVAEYVETYVMLLENFGKNYYDEEILEALNSVIHYYQTECESVVEFYLLKIRYIAGFDVENLNVETILNEYIQNVTYLSEDYFRLRLRIAQYYIDISEYDKCLVECAEIKKLMNQCMLPIVYEIELCTVIGVCYATTYRENDLAEKYLLEVVELSKSDMENKRVIRLLSTVYHYLGRVYEFRKQLTRSMEYFLLGAQYQFHSNLETLSEGFFHLRIAESLLSCKLYEQAYDHLQMCDSMLNISNHRGSAWTQLQVANALYEMTQGNYADAESILVRTLEFSKQNQFVRGQLLCLGYLLTLQLRRGYFWHIPKTVVNILLTAINGELKRNNIVKLFINLPRLIRFLFDRMTGSGEKAHIEDDLKCMCPLHEMKGNHESCVNNSVDAREKATYIRSEYRNRTLPN
jgi:hypothetical protein